jgi:nucleoside-diphosphate-sugar epimerase
MGRREPTLALTGATGFIGRALARRFVELGWRVKALVRNPSRASLLGGPRLELVAGDLEDLRALQTLVSGAAAIVHCAGAVRGTTLNEFARVNVDGVRNLVQIAREGDPAPFFLSLSSLAAREPRLSPYAHSKHAGEEALAAAAGDMPWLALRPPAVYGPGDREMLPLLRGMMRGVALVLGPAHARFSMLYVDDLVAAVEHCLKAQIPPTGIFELHDGHCGGYTWNELVSTAASLRGGPVRQVRLPQTLLAGAARLSVTWARLSGQAPMFTPGKLRELRHPDWVCDNRAFHQASGWSPAVDFAEGLRRTVGGRVNPLSTTDPARG